MILNTKDIFDVLNGRRPVSIVRAGDGEGIVLNSTKDLESYRLCINSVMKRQMGYEPTMGDVEKIRQNLITAYGECDIVGLPMHSQLQSLNKHWKDVENIVKPLCNTRQFCSTDIGYDLLYAGLLDEWLMGKTRVNYISCRDIDQQLQDRYKITTVNSYIIAPEAKFTSSYEGQRHYPEAFNQMEWWMNAAPCDRTPCLVGAGVIGKIYCNWFRDRGGIAIDLGAVFDLWAGFSTRGPKRGLDAIDETYKL